MNTAAASKPRLVADDPVPPPVRRQRPLKLRLHSLLRWLHIYTSMASLLIVLFFGLTGVTLNHPDWLATESTKEVKGQLSTAWKSGANVDWLVVAEELKTAQGVHGTASDRRADRRRHRSRSSRQIFVDCVIDMATGRYDVTIAYQGAIGVLNDLHRGRDAGTAWAWLIDATGGFLAFIAVTGLGLLVYLKKVRVAALLTMVGGAALVVGRKDARRCSDPWLRNRSVPRRRLYDAAPTHRRR